MKPAKRASSAARGAAARGSSSASAANAGAGKASRGGKIDAGALPLAGALPGRRTDPLKEFCRTIPGTTEDVKWGDDLVFSIGGKMYAAFDVEGDVQLGFKCDDDDFDRLTQIDGIIPAPYAARFGWVAVKRRECLSEDEIKSLLRKARDLVFAKLPAKTRRQLGGA